MEELEPITIKVFYSYARTEKDTPLRDELEKHLGNLKRQGFIADWSDQNIIAGGDREEEIHTNLENADIVLLLISPDFMHSDYCYSIELKRALEKHTKKQAEIIPILLRPVDWEGSLFSHLQALPTNTEPITTWPNQDKAFLDTAKGIKMLVKNMLIQKHVEKAEELLSNGKTEKALVYCDNAIQIDCTIKRAFFIKGEAFYALNRYEEAIESYEKAIRLEPDNAEYYNNLGATFSNLERYEEAIEPSKKAINLDPDNAKYYNNLGITLFNLGRHEEAIEPCEKAINLEPDNAEYYNILGDSLFNLKRYEEAAETCKKAMILDPNNAGHYNNLGITLFNLGRYEEAIDPSKKAINLEPDNIIYYEQAAQILESWAKELRTQKTKLEQR